MGFVLHCIQSLFCLIDECVYEAASMVYSLLIYIAESNLFNQEVIQSFATKIYVLIGVFMLFKVSFSLINYIVNPDDFTNGERGVNKLVSNIMITLVLIVFTPRIFAEVMDLQHLITSQHFFEKIIFSGSYANNISKDMGDTMAVEMFNAFYTYDTSSKDFKENADSDTVALQSLAHPIYEGSPIYVYNDLEAAFDGGTSYNAYDGIWDDTSEYIPILSTAAGIILILVLIQFCFDIAIRTIKFGFLQLIAPIPIISRMDPKSAKNGLFSRWLKQCIKTYLDLFVRLIALYFAIYMIQLFLNTSFQVPESSEFTELIVRAALMLGSLLFAKQLPKFLEELFGFNLGSGFTLNPMKRLKEIPGSHLVSAGIAGIGGAAVGGAANLYARIRKNVDNEKFGIKDALGVVGSTFAGAASGLFRSSYSGLKDNKNQPFKAIGKGVKGSVNARNIRDERKEVGENDIFGFIGRRVNSIDQFAGIVGSDEASIKQAKKNKLGNELYKKYGEYQIDANGNLIPDGKGGFLKTGYSKYDMLSNKELGKLWQQIDDYKLEKYAYENVSDMEFDRQIKEKGYYELKYKTEDGKLHIQQYKNQDEFNSDKSKAISAYSKLSSELNNKLAEPNNSEDKNRYEAFNSSADSIEAVAKLHAVRAGGKTVTNGSSGGTYSESASSSSPIVEDTNMQIIGQALHTTYNEKNKYEMVNNEKLRTVWQKTDEIENIVNAYKDIKVEDVTNEIKKNGSYKVKYTDLQGKENIREYKKASEFSSFVEELNKSYEAAGKKLQEELNNLSNAEDSIRYHAYNNFNSSASNVDIGDAASGMYYADESIKKQNMEESYRNFKDLQGSRKTVSNEDFLKNMPNGNNDEGNH